MLSTVIGQSSAKQKIINAFEQNRLAHAYLIAGEEGLGAEELALAAAQYFSCDNPDKKKKEFCGQCPNCKKISSFQHADLHYYFPTLKSTEENDMRAMLEAKADAPYTRVKVGGGSIHIGDPENPERMSIRGLAREMSLRSFEGRMKIFILTFIEEMNAEATNAILKILEEPPANALYFLTTSQLHALLPTVISRSQLVKLHKIPQPELVSALIEKHSVAKDQAEFMAELSGGNYYHAWQMITGDLPVKRDAMLEFLLAAASPKTITIQKVIAELLEKSEKDKTFFYDMLNLMGTWFQDVFYRKNLPPELAGRFLINRDKAERLDKFVKAFPHANVEQVLSEIEKAVDLIGRNIYLNLILMNLGLRIRECLHPKQ